MVLKVGFGSAAIAHYARFKLYSFAPISSTVSAIRTKGLSESLSKPLVSTASSFGHGHFARHPCGIENNACARKEFLASMVLRAAHPHFHLWQPGSSGARPNFVEERC